MERHDVVVVGGGQAGLAMGGFLAQRGRDFVILDAADIVGATWSERWDSLELFTPARLCGLPGLPFPGDPDRLPGKDDVAAYLRSYRDAFDLPVRHGVRVTSVTPAGVREVGWRVRTAGGDELLTRHVVVATGPFQRPFVPDCAPTLAPEVLQLHSSAYRRPQQLPDGPVLVVGGGNSGVQIAGDLASTGRETWLAVGSRMTRLPVRVAGRSVFHWLDALGAMDLPVTSRLGRRASTREFLVGESPAMVARRTGVELADRVVACRHDALLTADLNVVRPAAVVWATGFRTDFSWIQAPVFDARGRPIHHRGLTGAPGLHFLGLSWLHTRGSALLGWVGRDAEHLGRAIVGQSRRANGARSLHHSRSPAVITNAKTERGRTVEVAMQARPAAWRLDDHTEVDAWTYDGEVPGPVIEGRVGDTLVVRLTNALPEPTTIHWHGVRLPAAMDGTELVQRAVQPGETFEYRFDLLDAGTFWYHPHANETVQMERGLYGALIVRGPDQPEVDRERVLILDDLLLDRRGRIAKAGGWLERHNGREGRVRVVNGRVDPEIVVPGGQVERWRVVNAASARYVRLSVGGRPFRIIGTDGGLLEVPVEATDVLLTPGDRFDLAVGPFEEGEAFALEALPYDRGTGRRRRPERWARVIVGPQAPSRAVLPERMRTIEPLADASHPSNREVRLGGRMSLRRGVDFLIDGEPHHHGEPVRVGELQVWDVVNETPLDHPFHLHGFFFQVLEHDGVAPAYRSWEDTVNVPAKGRVRIAWLPDDRPGSWMYHCHILEHAEAGMMAHFEVVGPDGAASGGQHRSCHPPRGR